MKAISDKIELDEHGNPLKIHVLMFSVKFPRFHPRAGQETGFVESILTGRKKTTIRPYSKRHFKMRDDVKAGKAYLSCRYWTGLPYRSEQVEFKRLFDFDVAQCFDLHDMRVDDETVAKNDGLSLEDFKAWFNPRYNLTDTIIYLDKKFRYWKGPRY